MPPGSGLSTVTDTLAAREIVGWAAGFKAYARVRGTSRAIKPGIYEIQRGTEWGDILDKLVAGDVIEVALVVPEGWSSVQIAQRIAKTFNVPADTVEKMLLDTTFARRLDVPGPTLEGYLYPATYSFPITTRPRAVAGALVRRYKQVWTPQLRARADSLGLSEREVVTLASIVEKEAKQWGERDTIAAVYHNRLRIGMPLQADPTVQYALGAHQTRLLYSHIRDVRDHPYNTYTQRGLPPGPIASPSEGTIKAVLAPANVPFLYFVAEPNGSHVFTRTLAEHNAAKRRIQRMQAATGGRGE
ncbi:MAG: endolytic transglycosylase MltG [Gemmatimonadetes bacterium]|nr:endolytic transglycosylase MltG [Gemmatimonadota bacterium]